MSDGSASSAELLRHLVRMHSAGLPWLQSLQMWRDACRRPQQAQAVQVLMDALGQGLSLTEALGQGGWLSRPMQALSRAGEASGTWAVQMGQWLERHDRQVHMRRQLRSALAYPLLVALLALLVLAGVMNWVLPVFESLYRSLQAELPWATRALLALHRGWVSWAAWMWPVPLALGALGVMTWRDRRGRWVLERLLWQCPGVGRVWQVKHEALWCGLMSQLLQAGLDWSAALNLAGPATGSLWMSQASLQMSQDLARGYGLASAMAAGNRRWQQVCGREVFSATLVQWAQAGEAAGTLAALLQQWAAVQTDALAEHSRLVSRILEPLLMGLLGLGMAWLVLALYLPVVQMGQWL